jgi:catechol 2,3-dioxygenase-like lactoylglutathione lyase family enzyme
MQIGYVVLKVDDQDKALTFYTEVLGFRKKTDVGGGIRWLTVESPDGIEGVELVLEPNSMPPALASQKALYDSGFPATIFSTNDIDADYQRLLDKGVEFRSPPKSLGDTRFAFFDDTCGNLIVLSERRR